MLQIANGGKKNLSESVINSPNSQSNNIKKWEELASYKKSRDQSQAMIAAVTCDVTEVLTVPHLTLNCTDLNSTNFSGELAKILLEPESSIIFVTENLSETGSTRLALLLRDLKAYFDGRIAIFIHTENDVPAALSEYVEKVFETKRKRQLDITGVGSKMLKMDVEEADIDRDGEAEKTIKELKELIISKEAKFESKIALIDAEVQKKHNDLEEKINSQLSENTLLKEKHQQQICEISLLTEKNCSQLHEIDVLEEDNRKLQDVLEETESKHTKEIGVLEEKNVKLVRELVELEEINRKHLNETETLKEKNRKQLKEVLEENHRRQLQDSLAAEEMKKKHVHDTEVLEENHTRQLQDSVAAEEMKKKHVHDTEVLEEKNSKQPQEIGALNEVKSNQVLAETDKPVEAILGSESRIEHFKLKIKKHSQNSKLSAKEIVFRAFRNIKVAESVFENSENEQVCHLKITKDGSKILLGREFTATGASRYKSIMAAYSSVVSSLSN